MSTTNKDIAIFRLSIRFQNRLFLQKGLTHRFQTNLWIRSFSLILYRRNLLLLQYRRQPRGELRGEAEQDNFEGHNDGEQHGALDDLADGAVGADAFDDEAVLSDWRQAQPA
jgi:hypothetical protein